MQRRTLRLGGPDVPAIGLGCMPMSEFYGPADETSCIRTIRRAIDIGINLIDTAPSHGARRHGAAANEEIVARALKGRRDQVVLATKVGFVRARGVWTVRNTPAFIRRSIDESLTRLRVDHIDIYYLHRRDPRVPLADVIGAMAELVTAGKVRHLGLSEVCADTLRQAEKIHPIAALQTEYSLLSRHIESAVLPAARELGIGIVAYAPLGRALLADGLTSLDALTPTDLRRSQPRFQDGNLRHNLTLVGRLRTIANQLDCTPAQLALAWLMSKGRDIVPIPSTRRMRHLEENAAATRIMLAPEQMALLETACDPGQVLGARNSSAGLALMES